MSLEEHLIAGENIYLEKKGEDVVIHCSSAATPFRNMHGGFFRLNRSTMEDAYPQLTLSNCIFRLNGRYIRLDDYVIDLKTNLANYIYLQISDVLNSCSIRHYIYDKVEDEEIIDDDSMILLYVIHSRDYCVQVESFAAGSLIDTHYLQEGFVYMHHEKGLRTTVTRNIHSDDVHEFADSSKCYFIPSYDPVSDDGVNICVPYEKGGVLEGGRNEMFYKWESTGLPAKYNSFYVMVSADGVYYAEV